MEKTKKILKIAGSVIAWVFVAFAVVITVLAFSSQLNSDGTGAPNIAGVTLLTVQSDSMSGTFETGDLLIAKALDDSGRASLSVGDVITFRADLDGDGITELNSHRIVAVAATNADGAPVSYITKGDHNPANDKNPVRVADILCRWDGKKLSGVGAAVDFLKSPTGFLICIVLPLVAFFLFELGKFIWVVVKVKQEENAKKADLQKTAATLSPEEEEEIKKRAIEEYLRRQAETTAPAETSDENGEKKD